MMSTCGSKAVVSVREKTSRSSRRVCTLTGAFCHGWWLAQFPGPCHRVRMLLILAFTATNFLRRSPDFRFLSLLGHVRVDPVRPFAEVAYESTSSSDPTAKLCELLQAGVDVVLIQ